MRGERDRGDEEPMRRALAVSRAARTRAAPNPWVGCVLVADGVVVGEGASQPPGAAHAEVEALARAGDRARGATAYVTLEPCPHHGRTPPCADALAAAGVRRVVVALTDPDPRVSGGGVDRLRAAGVEVVLGVGARAAAHELAPYLHHRRTGRAFCLAKVAASLDGRVAAPDGTSRWVTGPAARADAHRLRAESQAVVVGSGTAVADRPALTVRDAPAPHRAPLRVLLDARGRVPAEGPLFDPALAPTLVVTTERAPATALDAWRCAGAKVELVEAAPGGEGVDVHATLALLGRLDVLQAMVEGGPRLHGSLLAAGAVDRLVAYLAPTVLGPGGRAAFDGDGPATIADAERWRLVDATVLGDDVRVELEPVHAGGA
jgi:diaminohydroxyphosphoribosylaminopyrimidine deaminase/5-amino-6-(5-phosphoribosylamino)uracil reductase